MILKPELTCVQDIIVQYSEDTTIEIMINANPSPDVKWLKDGIEVTLTEKVTITTEEGSCIHKLSISHCELEDAGTYSLLATNTEGQTQADVKLVVHSKFTDNHLLFCCWPNKMVLFAPMTHSRIKVDR